MKVAHVKTIDGTTIMLEVKPEFDADFIKFLTSKEHGAWIWEENNETCMLYRQHIISVRFREVEDK